MRVAIYRIHYGLDYLQQSIESITDCVDAVYVFYSSRPWCKDTTLTYRGQQMDLPELPENIYQFAGQKLTNKVTIIPMEFDTADNQYYLMYKHVCEHYEKPTKTLMLEMDYVFAPGDCARLFEHTDPVVSTKQIEMWRSLYWRVPQRDRLGVTLWNTDVTPTQKDTYDIDKTVRSDIQNYNFGFCMSPEVMYYKHLVAIMGSAKLGDSIPNESWYEDKWRNWTPETENLEISLQHAHTIKRAEPFEPPCQLVDYMQSFDNKYLLEKI